MGEDYEDEGEGYGTPPPDYCPCECVSPKAGYKTFRCYRSVGVDETDGRFADVRIDECVHCHQLWLHYQVEYEAFSRSGRWARGIIRTSDAEKITPEQAPDFLARLPSYLYGGSYFDRESGVRSGPMHWGI